MVLGNESLVSQCSQCYIMIGHLLKFRMLAMWLLQQS